MAGNVFNRYLWLIELIRREGPITFSEISNKWEYAAINETRERLPRKTFYNHCTKIDEIFDLNIKYKNSFGYYIEEPEESEVWKLELLNRLLLHSAIKDNPSLANKVKNLDCTSHDELPIIVECIQKQAVISFVKPIAYHLKSSKRGTLGSLRRELIRKGKHYSDFLVLSAVEVDYRWFAIGAFIEQDKPFEQWRIAVFKLNGMKEIKVQYESKTDFTQAFNLQEYLDTFAFDKSDKFDDDRASFEQCLSNYRLRTRYGCLAHSIKIK